MANAPQTYSSSPFTKRTMAMRGMMNYSIGSYNDQTGFIVAQVTQVGLTSNVATVSLTARSGFTPPVIGELISISGTQTADSSPATQLFNVTQAPITAVSGFNSGDNSQGTVSFALSGNNISATADAGMAVIEVVALTPTIATNTVYKGIQFALPELSLGVSQGDSIVWAWKPASTDTIASIEVDFQIADVDLDANYTTLDKSTNTAGETRQINSPVNAGFARIIISALSSTGSIHPVGYFKV